MLLLNRGTTTTAMNVSWQQLGLDVGTQDDVIDATDHVIAANQLSVYDVLLQQMTNGTHRGGYTAQVPSHDVAFIIVHAVEGVIQELVLKRHDLLGDDKLADELTALVLRYLRPESTGSA